MKLATTILLLLLAATARADSDALDGRWRLENSFGFRTGSFLVNNIDMAKVEGHVMLGVRRGRWSPYVEYGLLELGMSDDVVARGVLGQRSNGLLHRFGTNLRYAYGRHTLGRTSFEIFADAGIGVQHLRWDAGGTWTRPDVSLGVGTTTWTAGESKHFGTTLGLRVLLARRSDLPDDAPVACGGPCDMATRPTGLDRSLMFDFAVHFGT